MRDVVARGGGNYHDQQTQGRCPVLCNTAPLGLDDIFLARRHGYTKLKRIADQRKFHAPGASTLHGMARGVKFWRCYRTLHGMTRGVRPWRRY